MQAEACQLVHYDTAIHTARQQHSYPLILNIFSHAITISSGNRYIILYARILNYISFSGAKIII